MFGEIVLPAGRDRGAQLDALTIHAERCGLAITYARLPGLQRGAYHHADGRVFLREGMTAGATLAALAHELGHFYRGDTGPQPSPVEAYIDEKVAEFLIDPGDYAMAESLYDGATAGIALELDLPRAVVSAYRRPLWRGGTIGVQSVTRAPGMPRVS